MSHLGLTFVVSRPARQVAHSEAITEGLRKFDIPVCIALTSNRVRTKHVACWGWRIGKRLLEAGFQVLVLERGYLGDRFSYTSLGWNGLNGNAVFPKYTPDNGERFRETGAQLKDWKTDGEYVLITGQVPRDASLRGIDLMPYYEKWAKEAAEAYHKPVLFRPHPDVARKGGSAPPGIPLCTTPTLAEALDKAFLCINFNSNSGVDAILAGVPTVTFDKGSMAYDVCGHRVRELIRPKREDWAYSLAYTQWTLDEIRSGLPLEKVAYQIRHG